MSFCITRKRIYQSQAMAEDALIEARIRFDQNSAVAVYLCDECGGWHLTSQGEMSPRLKQELNNGQIKREKEAMYWQKKLR